MEVADRNADSRNPAVSTETEDDAGLPATLKKILASPEVASVCVHRPRIAVAKDEAFCFIYEDNLGLLKELGAEITFFSPLHDKHFPENCDGLLLYGGYPELSARELSENVSMRQGKPFFRRSGFPCRWTRSRRVPVRKAPDSHRREEGRRSFREMLVVERWRKGDFCSQFF